MEEEKKYNFFRFEDLRLYDKAINYIEWVYHTTNLFPEIESGGGLAARFLRAAQNIAINIAEGSGRNKQQFVQYLKDGKTSIRECLVITTIAHRLQYISEDTKEESREQLIELSKMLGALITSLQKGSGKRPEPRLEFEEESIN